MEVYGGWDWYGIFDQLQIMEKTLDIDIHKHKQNQLTHITQKMHNYKQTYLNRPLIPRNADTYLQFTSFLSQILPTFLQHYQGTLNTQEQQEILQHITTLQNDIVHKIKTLAHKLQQKEQTNQHKHNTKEICRVCLQELRTIEVTNTKEELESQHQISQSMMKIIKEVEEDGPPFSREEDQHFFQELKTALDKKQEVLQICGTESEEFTRVIQEQLKQFASLKEVFTSKVTARRESNADCRSQELQQNVGNSIKQSFNSKLPIIISIVSKTLQKALQRQKRMNRFSVQTQTIQLQNSKMLQMKKKLAQVEASASMNVKQREKLNWTIHQKNLLLGKVEEELTKAREEFNQKQFQMVKEIKKFEDKCRKLKQQMEKQRLKSKKQIMDRQFAAQTTMKSFKTLHKMKQVVLMEAQLKKKQALKLQEEQDPQFDRKSRRKRTLYNTKGSSTKFFLPTLTKLARQDSQLLSKSQLQVDKVSKIDLNQTVKTQFVKEQDTNQNDKQKDNFSKTGALMKKGKIQIKKILTMNPNNTRKQSQSGSPTTTQRKDEKTLLKTQLDQSQKSSKNKQNTQIQRQTSKRSNKSTEGNPKPQLPSLASPTKDENKQVAIDQIVQNKQIQVKQMRQSVRSISKKLQEKKMRTSYTSLNSAVSILHGVNADNHKNSRDGLNRSPKIKAKRQSIREACLQHLRKESNQSVHKGQVQQSPPHLDYQRSNLSPHQTKSYNVNSYSKINEEVDKQSSVTPALGSETPGEEARNRTELQKLIAKNIETNLGKIMEDISIQGEALLKIKYRQFSDLFAKCLTCLKQNPFHSTLKTQLQRQLLTTHTSPFESRIAERPPTFHKKHFHTETNESPQKSKYVKPIIAELSIGKKTIYRESRFSTQVVGNKNVEGHREARKTNYREEKKDDYKQWRPYEIDAKNCVNQSKEMSPGGSSTSPKQLALAKKRLLGQSNLKIEPLNLDFTLFIDDEKAYEYQSTFAKKSQKLPSLPPFLQHLVNQLFLSLEQLKYLHNQTYNHICSYLRYPFTNSQKGAFHIDIIQNISLASLMNCVQKMMGLHRKCKGEEGVCTHFKEFKAKIEKYIRQYQ